jgi:hypothetical protein
MTRLVRRQRRIGRTEPTQNENPGFPHARRWVPGLPRRTVQLCIHCRENPAGFWVRSQGDQTVRRPWCLSCCEGLDPSRCDVILFGS